MAEGAMVRGGHGTSRPAGRVLAVALLALLWVTGVHGASSLVAPAGAIATAHASVGAAVLHPVPSGDRVAPPGTADGSRAAASRSVAEHLRPDTEQPPAVPRPRTAPARPDDPVATSTDPPPSVLLTRTASTHQGRAPPA